MSELLSAPTQIDFAMVSGDTKTIRVVCVGPDRQPFSLAEVVALEWQLAKTVKGAPLITKTMGAGTTVVQDGDNWMIDVDLEPADSEDLAGDYYHECQFRLSNGVIVTPFAGTGSFTEDLI